VAEFPQLGNEPAPDLPPAHLEPAKSDEINQRALDLGLRLVAAGVLTKKITRG
jgi:hypothetical protein